jgi:hypothetical protein
MVNTHTQTCAVGNKLVPHHVGKKSHKVAIPCSRRFPVQCTTTWQQYKFFFILQFHDITKKFMEPKIWEVVKTPNYKHIYVKL